MFKQILAPGKHRSLVHDAERIGDCAKSLPEMWRWKEVEGS